MTDEQLFDLLMALSDEAHERRLFLTSRRIEDALDALLTETGRVQGPRATPVPAREVTRLPAQFNPGTARAGARRRAAGA